MKLTAKRIAQYHPCRDQLEQFRRRYPRGVEPTVQNLAVMSAEGLKVQWLYHLLPCEGPGSRRAYALWCVQQVAHLCNDRRFANVLRVIERRVRLPKSVTDNKLRGLNREMPIWMAAWRDEKKSYGFAVFYAASIIDHGAAGFVALHAALVDPDAEASTLSAQLACLAQLLAETP